MSPLRAALLVSAVALCALAGLAGADGGKLGGYEKQALTTALERRNLEVEPAPEGKVVGRIRVVNLDVFAEDSSFLQWFNIFHWTTREHVIEREVLVRPGEVWDPERIAETKRRLSDPLFTAVVVVTAVKSDTPGKVDILIVTRDI